MAKGPVPYVDSIPLVGDWNAKIGRVVNITANPCSPEPQIIVYAAFAAFPMMLWTLFKPDPVDARYDLFGRGHKKKWKWRIGQAHVLMPQIPWNRTDTAFAFTLGDLAQRVGWYFVIIDATLDFLVNWTSMVYAYSGCPASGGVYSMQSNAGVVYGSDNGWGTFTNWAKVGSNKLIPTTNGLVVPKETTVNASLSAVGQPFPFPTSQPCTFDTRIIHQPTQFIVAQGSSKKTANGMQAVTITGRYTNPFAQDHGLEYQIKANGDGNSNFDGSTAQAWGWGTIGLKPDP